MPGSSRSKRENSRGLQKRFSELVGEIVEQRDPDDNRPVLMMALDKGRFGRITDIRSCWAPKGIRPKAPVHVARTFVYVYAAVCMALGKMTSLILPYANTDMMNLFPVEVSAECKEYL